MAELARLLPPLLHGAEITAGITLVSTLLGAVLAFVAGSGRLARNPALRYSARVYVEIFRGTSLLVQLFWLFFALPLLGINLSPLSAGILGLGLNIGAYGAEVVRGAMQAVPRGQLEAARALNFKPLQAIPKLKKEFKKETSIVGFIPHVEGETVVMNLDREGICISTRSACNSASVESSHVLRAIGRLPEQAYGSVRLTLGKWTTEEDVERVLDVMPRIVAKLRLDSPLYNKR